MSAACWLEITLSVPSELAEDCSALLTEETGTGTYQLDPETPGDRPRIRGFVTRDETARACLIRIKKRMEGLFSFFPEMAPPGWDIRLIAAENWQENWKRHFKPQRVCSGIVVCPTWEEYQAAPGEKVLLLDPGQAFGTGGHASTRLCLRIMEELKGREDDFGRPFRRVLDVGTGTGILALAAALYDAESVLGIDQDPLAVESARNHVEINRLASVIRISTGGPETVSGVFSLVLANLTRDDLLALDKILSALPAADGFLVLSGVLTGQAREVIRAYSLRGLVFRRLYLDDEWAAILFSKVRD